MSFLEDQPNSIRSDLSQRDGTSRKEKQIWVAVREKERWFLFVHPVVHLFIHSFSTCDMTVDAVSCSRMNKSAGC